MMTNAGGAVAEAGWPRRGSISSATAADGKTARKRHGKWWEKRPDGERADADMCKSLRCSPWRNATKR